MTVSRQPLAPATADPSLEDIAANVDMDVVADILRRSHPDLAEEDIAALIREVMGDTGG